MFVEMCLNLSGLPAVEIDFMQSILESQTDIPDY